MRELLLRSPLAVRMLCVAFVLSLVSAAPGLVPASAAQESEGGLALEGEVDPLFDDFEDEDYEEPPAGYPDPAEVSNRGLFAFNEFVDRWLFSPITSAYRFIFPDFARKSIRRVFINLGEPGTMVNNMLQLEWKDAGVAGGRFLINTTIGLGGLFDPASAAGLEHHVSDFGQTLALAGTPSGAYIVLPIFGPSNVRDGVGLVSDGAAQPITWFLGPVPLLIYSGSEGVSTRDEVGDQLDALRESSVDFYAAMRNAYYQNREAEVWGRRQHRQDDWGAPDGD